MEERGREKGSERGIEWKGGRDRNGNKVVATLHTRSEVLTRSVPIPAVAGDGAHDQLVYLGHGGGRSCAH